MLQSVIWDLGSYGFCYGFMWSKVIEKRRKANGLKRDRLKRSDPLETSNLSLLMIARI
jgi:hypothetical protein